MIQSGTILNGRYEILEHIGSGGMADVYRARCHKENRFVAVKILRQEYNDDEAFVRKFIREAQSTAELHHPNLVDIYDAGNENGIHYIVMELAEGMTLKRYIRRYGRLSARETVDFAIQIAGAISVAHKNGIVHRDIKPQNILVSDRGVIKVTDFGIAKAATGDTVSANTMGSVRYLSPEQARGGYSDSRSDIYSLGITIYEMATGRVPFDGDNAVAIALMHLQEEITPPRCFFPDIPVSLENIILKCTMKHPEERYQTAQQLIDDLKQVFDSPDGTYVYVNPVVDDCPTRKRTEEDMEAIRQSLGKSSKETVTGQDTISAAQREDAEDYEDEEDDERVRPKMQKVAMLITIVLGVLLACFIIFFLGRSLRRLGSEGNTTEKASTEISTEKTTEETVKVKVPSFLGLSMEKAKERAQHHSLKAEFEYDDNIDDEVKEDDLVVIKQQYDSGKEVEEGATVLLTLGMDEASTQPERIEVPVLMNYTEEQAQQILEQAGLKMKKIYADSSTVKENYVIRQNPTAGSIVDKGFTVTVTISRGVKQVRVPSLSGLTQEAAERELKNVGLKLGSVSSGYSGSVGIGEVIEQNPASGTSVDQGTAVSIVISLGEQETYHYEGELTVDNNPFDEDNPSGKVELILEQDGHKETLYSDNNATADSFPLSVSFDTESDAEALVKMYVNVEIYDMYTVELNAVAD